MSENVTFDRWLRPPDAARYMGMSSSTLAKMRLTGDGPHFRKPCSRIVLYRVDELDAWLDESRRHSTSETSDAGDRVQVLVPFRNPKKGRR